MNRVMLEQSLEKAEAKLEDLRRKADDAMQAVARQRIEVEKIKGELEKVRIYRAGD